MPKHEIFHPEGQQLPPELEDFLKRYFKNDNLQKLKKFGGRILISIAAPYSTRRKKTEAIKIDHQFLMELESLKDSSDKVREFLHPLTIKELRELCDSIGQPVRSKASAAEIRSEIIRHLQAEGIWNRISGTASSLTTES